MPSPPPFAAMNPERQRLETIDSALRRWACQFEAEEDMYSVLIPADTLHRAEYDRAFPHLLMSAAVNAAPGAERENIRHAGHYLSPAVCYHTYAALAEQVLPQGTVVTARGRCFRNEEASQLKPGRRQIEFEMREIVFVGT